MYDAGAQIVRTRHYVCDIICYVHYCSFGVHIIIIIIRIEIKSVSTATRRTRKIEKPLAVGTDIDVCIIRTKRDKTTRATCSHSHAQCLKR